MRTVQLVLVKIITQQQSRRKNTFCRDIQAETLITPRSCFGNLGRIIGQNSVLLCRLIQFCNRFLRTGQRPRGVNQYAIGVEQQRVIALDQRADGNAGYRLRQTIVISSSWSQTTSPACWR